MKYVIAANDPISSFAESGGGKAAGLARLTQAGFPVPAWFCISSQAFEEFITRNRLSDILKPSDGLAQFAEKIEAAFVDSVTTLPPSLEKEIQSTLDQMGLLNSSLAVRSSGLDEDSKEHSFAGQFSTFLNQNTLPEVLHSVKKCWASAYSERAISYRLERGLPISPIKMGIVIQKMVAADVAGVGFSRNPVDLSDREHLILSSVFGLGDGLVNGDLDADQFKVNRTHLGYTSQLVTENATLTDVQVKEVSQVILDLEKTFQAPQDCEWAYEKDVLKILQTRPITHLPEDAFFDKAINGDTPILWDNSNIIESYSGVTSPLTFSFASAAYRQVYIQFCEVIGVPASLIQSHEPVFRNMLGLLRGRIYYNLIHWYRLVILLPGASSNKAFMETMMGVKQKLQPQFLTMFDSLANPPRYSLARKTKIGILTLYRLIRIDSIIGSFQAHFNEFYEKARRLPLSSMPLGELSELYRDTEEKILRRWHAPIINDYLCMIFFGLLKKQTEAWLGQAGEGTSSLQNDLLCGEGGIESTEPTKMLMRIAEKIDTGDAHFKEWFLNTPFSEIWNTLKNRGPKATASLGEIGHLFEEFLDRYGFRCVNELKLEEPDLHDDPTFAVSAVSGYIRMKNYSIQAMEAREHAIREKAESTVRSKLSKPKLWVYFWVLGQARKAVRNRESLRFARTKIFGIARHIFRGMGAALTKLGALNEPKDIFYLTVDEIFSYIEGRSVLLDLKSLVGLRKSEYDRFRKTPAPPDRLLTTGAVGANCTFQQILTQGDLLKDESRPSGDPNVLVGTPCCPGVVEGTVRVVDSIQDAQGFRGEILVTARTDPGWVPLFPSCTGLLIERGSLLSHSAVVARELGLPTIVGISGGLVQKLKTGQRVRMDAAKGEVRILA